MAKIQCGKCGGQVELPDGATSGECPNCGSFTAYPENPGEQTDRPVGSEEESLQKKYHDKAADVYESILDLIEDEPAEKSSKTEKKKEREPSSPFLEKYEAKLTDPCKPEPRLPRMGCFLVFLIFLILGVSFSGAFYHSVGEMPAKYSIPEEYVSVTDTEGILLERDRAALEALANEISGQADCGVAVMFFDAQLANMLTVFDQVAAEWAPGKGVLLICNVRNSTMRFGLIGPGWQLADWDLDTVDAACRAYRKDQRGAKAVELLTRLKQSLDTVEKTTCPDGNADGAESGKTTASAEKKPDEPKASGKDKDSEVRAAAGEKAAEAKIAAEDKAAEEALDEEEFEDDESVGMRANAEKNGKKGKYTGILYSSNVVRGGEGSARNWTVFFLVATVLVAVIALKNGKKTREADLKRNPTVIAEFRRKSGKNPALRLVDTNEYEPAKWTHKKFLRITAIVMGILLGLSAGSPETDSLVEDHDHEPDSLIPDYPEDGRIVDQAGVFSPDGRAIVSAAIDHLKTNTGGEMIVYTVKTINGRPIEEFSMDAATKWKIGKKGQDNGALLVIAVNDHRDRLEIGYGWEGPIPDGRAGSLLRDIVPELSNEKYAEAAVKVVRGVESYVTGIPVQALAESDSAAPAAKPKAHVPAIKDYGTLAYEKPKHDPRVLDPADSTWGLIGIVGCLIAIIAAYWGRIVMTSAPHLVIVDPTAVHVYTPSSGSGGSGSSSRSYSRSSSSRSSSSSSRRSSGGGGSFGGGGASGRW